MKPPAAAPWGGIGFPGPEPGVVASRRALDELVRSEVTSREHYERRLARPTVPPLESGITIGIGYDLGHTAQATTEQDWRGRVPGPVLDWYLSVAGAKGDAARRLLLHGGEPAQHKVPWEAAAAVLETRVLPRWARRMAEVWENVELLPADAQGALLSVAYNRGLSLRGARRREMAAIQQILQEPALDMGDRLRQIAGQVRAMGRLWPGTGGLRARREREAALIAGALRAYAAGELVRVI